MNHSNKPVRKAVIAAAGFGTRFLPQTKAMPKEMLPLVDKPIVQYIVEELVGAGIEDIIIVTGYHKRSIEDHFDEMSTDLRNNLDKPGKEELLKQTEGISDLANFIYIRQKGPYGNATPVLNAEHLVNEEPFIYTFADDFFVAKPSRFQQMITKYQQTGSSVLPCMRIKDDVNYSKYGVVAGDQIDPGVIDMKTIIEKPGKKNAPSDLASVTGYLLTPDIFPYLREAKAELEAGKEFMIQAAMQKMIQDNHQMLALEIKNGRYYDTGNKLDYVKTLVDFALKHDDIKDDFAAHLKQLQVQ
ncbi:MAG: UTP--glucose-1-phosphate uridylyltransferase [Actinobacteria bacterium]|nr:UTP--glucose-1-phosphate uridylyltransferase [Actinomycetota bacterium]